jgi:MFS family permease
LGYIRAHREIRWSLIYLGIAASLVGVLGVLGPNFAQHTLGLGPEDFVVVVLPLGVGIVMGILLLNAYGRLLPRRRVIEGGLIALGAFLAAMALSGRISSFLGSTATRTGVDLSLLTSLLSIVVALAFFAGISYAAVAIPAQTQLQEDLPEDVRGRVFGVLNMLVSVASFLPILVVGPIADLAGTTIVLVVVAILIIASGLASIYLRGPLRAVERDSRATVGADRDPFVTALGLEARSGATDLTGEPIADARAAPEPAEPPSEPAAPVGSVVAAVANPITPTADPVDADGVTERLAIAPAQEANGADAPDADAPDADSSGRDASS